MVRKTIVVVSFVFFIYTIESVLGRKLLGDEKITLGYGEVISKIRGSVGCEVGEGTCGEIREKKMLDGRIVDVSLILNSNGNGAINTGGSVSGDGTGAGAGVAAGAGVGAGGAGAFAGLGAGAGAGAGAGDGTGTGAGAGAGAGGGAGSGAGTGAGPGTGSVTITNDSPGTGAVTMAGAGAPNTAPSPGDACGYMATEYKSIFGFFNRGGW
ncbi:unnamed protein product [Lactuca virosa]|uniref:Uncharacterized protein n=1 Tax=Lactuca virosa TaxID=75947 RepID=A0AAU9N509_9ASTR|nr:unnamed protein product [Lactuca virosa]